MGVGGKAVSVAVTETTSFSLEKAAVARQGAQAGSGGTIAGSVDPITAHGNKLLLFTVALFSGIQRSHVQISSIHWFYSGWSIVQ